MWLNYRLKARGLKHTVELSNIEMEKMELIHKAEQKFSEN